MRCYPDWYKNPSVKFKMIKYTYNREVMFIKPVSSSREGLSTRMIRIHNVQHLDVWMKSMGIWNDKKDYNLYYSLARYKKGIPYGSLNLAERDFGDWTRENWKEIDAYDFLLDIDCANHKEIDFAYYSVKNIRNIFDILGVPYHLRFSGRGFHFIVPYDCFSELGLSFDPESENNIYEFYMDIAMGLHRRFSEMIDVGIYDLRRVVKIPFSIALYEGKEYLCRPFEDDDDFMNFRLKSMNPQHSFMRIREIHDNLFNENGNIYKLLNELGIKDGHSAR